MPLVTRSQVVAGVVEVYDNAIENCREIVAYLERRSDWNDAELGVEGGKIDKSVRNNDVLFFDPFSFMCHDLLRDMTRTVWQYLNDYGLRYGVQFAGLEPVNVNRYRSGGFYKPHADDGPGYPRVISALLYLNDVEEGGETEFIYHGVKVNPVAGRLIIFPSDYAYSHAAHPPLSGIKYSAAFWTTRMN